MPKHPRHSDAGCWYLVIIEYRRGIIEAFPDRRLTLAPNTLPICNWPSTTWRERTVTWFRNIGGHCIDKVHRFENAQECIECGALAIEQAAEGWNRYAGFIGKFLLGKFKMNSVSIQSLRNVLMDLMGGSDLIVEFSHDPVSCDSLHQAELSLQSYVLHPHNTPFKRAVCHPEG